MKKRKFRLGLPMLLLLMILVGLTTVAVGKYIKTISLSDAVTFTAKLADSVVIQESLAVKQPDGTYVLDQTKTVSSNTYALIPGVDVPKDTHIVITGKTQIPAYLYLTVKDMTDTTLEFTLCDHWVLYSGNTYVYSDANKNPVVITGDVGKIYILKDNTVYVSQSILETATNYLEFSAKLQEVSD